MEKYYELYHLYENENQDDITKFKGERSFKAIRLSYVASAKDRFISYCLSCIEKEEVADIFHPFYRNVISVSDVVNNICFPTLFPCNYI